MHRPQACGGYFVSAGQYATANVSVPSVRTQFEAFLARGGGHHVDSG